MVVTGRTWSNLDPGSVSPITVIWQPLRGGSNLDREGHRERLRLTSQKFQRRCRFAGQLGRSLMLPPVSALDRRRVHPAMRQNRKSDTVAPMSESPSRRQAFQLDSFNYLFRTIRTSSSFLTAFSSGSATFQKSHSVHLTSLVQSRQSRIASRNFG